MKMLLPRVEFILIEQFEEIQKLFQIFFGFLQNIQFVSLFYQQTKKYVASFFRLRSIENRSILHSNDKIEVFQHRT